MADYIRKIEVTGAPVYYTEDIGDIRIAPEAKSVKVGVIRKFYNANNELVKTEPGDEVEFTEDFGDLLDRFRKAVKKAINDRQ